MPIERVVVAQDAMTTRVRETLTLPCSEDELLSFIRRPFEIPTAPDSLRELMDALAEWMLKRGYPDMRGDSVHTQKGRFWCYFSRDDEDMHGSFSWPSTYILTVADPLSSEWYAANIYHAAWMTLRDFEENRWDSLFHRAFDLGRKFEEYEMRRRHLKTITAKLEHDTKNREHGAKGGQAEKKRERYKTLDTLARENLNSFLYASDAQAVRKARELAARHDKGAAEPLFVQGSKPLSRAWFDEWLANFRRQSRQAIDNK